MKILSCLIIILSAASAFAATYERNINSGGSSSNSAIIERNNRQDSINKLDTNINKYKNTPDGDKNDMRRYESERQDLINKR